MALENRIEALKRRHADIDQQLQDEVIRASGDQLAIKHLKALKLGVKDEIERLIQDQCAAA